jgi:tetratricopeptide (TPR) repeat protein
LGKFCAIFQLVPLPAARKPKVVVALQQTPGEQVLLELQARSAWNQRDYEHAQHIAEEAAALAAELDDDNAWWNMTFLQAECLRKRGLMRESAGVAHSLQQHPVTTQSIALAARVSTLSSLALQGCGDLKEAVVAGRHAATKSAEVGQDELQIEAQNALIAALADSDQLDDAWSECLVLADLVEDNASKQTAGMSYWAIGNVAFLLHRVNDGTKYHRLAAENLSPTNDLDLWARFNRASAALRLAAGVVEPETLECIDRAEMASSIVGGSERDRVELALTRGHWLVLTGQFDAAIERLRTVTSHESLLATHTAAEARLLLGQAFNARHIELEALLNLEASEQLFVQSGANDRAAVARHLIHEVQSR